MVIGIIRGICCGRMIGDDVVVDDNFGHYDMDGYNDELGRGRVRRSLMMVGYDGRSDDDGDRMVDSDDDGDDMMVDDGRDG